MPQLIPSDSESDAPAVESDHQGHIYDGNRCIFCNVNDLDEEVYGPFECIKRGQYIYTTETPGAGSTVQSEGESQP